MNSPQFYAINVLLMLLISQVSCNTERSIVYLPHPKDHSKKIACPSPGSDYAELGGTAKAGVKVQEVGEIINAEAGYQRQLQRIRTELPEINKAESRFYLACVAYSQGVVSDAKYLEWLEEAFKENLIKR